MALINELMQAHAEHKQRVEFEMSIEVFEGQPGWDEYQAAIAASEAAWEEMRNVQNRAYQYIFQRPVTSLADLVVAAYIAKSCDVEEMLSPDSGTATEAVLNLYHAVLEPTEAVLHQPRRGVPPVFRSPILAERGNRLTD